MLTPDPTPRACFKLKKIDALGSEADALHAIDFSGSTTRTADSEFGN